MNFQVGIEKLNLVDEIIPENKCSKLYKVEKKQYFKSANALVRLLSVLQVLKINHLTPMMSYSKIPSFSMKIFIFEFFKRN